MKLVLKYIFLLAPIALFSQAQKMHSVYLIGDAGEDTVSGKALLMLKDQLLKNPQSTVIFLGDNVYPSGFKIKDHKSELRIKSQLDILKEFNGNAYFIPGNHDWDSQKRKGQKKLKDEEQFVDDYLKSNSIVKNKNETVFLPVNGLPGPESIMLEKDIRLIIIDTQWFLHTYRKNKLVTKKQTKEYFYKRLDSLLEYSGKNNEQVIITAHHPMYTNGKHSRKLQPIRFIINYTPFQIFGQMGLNRLFSQDLSQPKYKKMRWRMLKSFDKYNNIVFASGHDHNLQLFKENGNRYIVSGCGSKTEHLQRKKIFKESFQDDSKTGFIKLEYYSDKKVVTTIYRSGEEPLILTDF
jgi:calcineurin-like phosphoesterase family protein